MEETLNRIKQLRVSLGMRQMDFADCLGMAGNSWSQIETGKNPLKVRHINLICLEFGVNREWLLSGKGKMFESGLKTSFEKAFEGLDMLTHEEQVFIGTYRKLTSPGKEVARATVDALLKAQAEKGEESEPAQGTTSKTG